MMYEYIIDFYLGSFEQLFLENSNLKITNFPF